MPSDPRIRLAMDTLARTLHHQAQDGEALVALTAGAVDAIPGATSASISVRHADGTLETLAPTDPLISELDAHQYELREGPCYEAVTQETLHVTFELGRDLRWPRYSPVAAGLGIRAQLAVLLTSNNGSRSALNVYADEQCSFDADSVKVAELFASHASVAMGFINTVETLHRGMRTRQTIGAALGIVMERYQIDHERAFQFLIRTSQDSNVKLREVANGIVAGLDSRTHHVDDLEGARGAKCP